MNKEKIIEKAIEFCYTLYEKYDNNEEIDDIDVAYLVEILKGREEQCMYKELIETKIMQTIGAYTIVKSVEQNYWYDGTRAGRMHNHYDVCLDGGNGDIVVSFDKLNEARKWAKEN